MIPTAPVWRRQSNAESIFAFAVCPEKCRHRWWCFEIGENTRRRTPAMESSHCMYGTKGSLILYFGYHAPKFTRMMSSEVSGLNSENTSSHNLLSYVPNDLHATLLPEGMLSYICSHVSQTISTGLRPILTQRSLQQHHATWAAPICGTGTGIRLDLCISP